MLDGTAFTEYSYVFAFCVVIPFFLDLFNMLSSIFKNQLESPKNL